VDDVGAVLGAGGPLSRVLPGYAPREVQIRMARDVAEAMRARHTLVVEAGTGTGKTFAYLVPALLGHQRVIVSTGTRHLQDQLYRKDLPTLREALGSPRKVALLKGRANYLCQYRLENALQQSRRRGHEDWRRLRQLADWAEHTASGDRAEFGALAEEHPLWTQVTATADNCLGGECPRYAGCFVARARRAAQEADIVVVNHHLLCADLALKETGFGELLPAFETLVLDEAHQLAEVAGQFFGQSLSARRLQALGQDLLAEPLVAGLDEGELQRQVDALGRAVQRLRLALGREERRAAWVPMLERDAVQAELAALDEALGALQGLLDPVAEASAGLQAGLRRAAELQGLLRQLRSPQPDWIQWFQTHRQTFAIHATPLDVAPLLQRSLGQLEAARIYTSATLAVGDDFSHFLARLGIEDAVTRQYASPFDYARHARLYLPPGLPEPNRPDYTARWVAEVLPLLRANPGGSFLLCTSYRALREAAGLLRDALDGRPLLVQGEGTRHELLQRFTAAGDAVLLGTSAFWEGVDVRGAALSCVVIDRLPFAAPGDPVLEARLTALREQGGSPFMDYQLPQAVITLKQGVGRLIRDVTDRGLLVICDPRLTGKRYGRAFLASLPDMPHLTERQAAIDFLRAAS